MYIKIKKATKPNIEKILKIECLTYEKHGWSKDMFISELNKDNSIYLVAEKSDTKDIIGYIGTWLIEDEAHITTMVVHPLYRKKHTADILLYSLISTLYTYNIKWVTLEVKSSNIAAINLYTKYGFKQIGIRKKYYQENNEDALILWTENINNNSFKENLRHINTHLSNFLVDADKYQYSI
jgi:ribosomal-protein-alanine N-acetyltransferase